MPELVVLRGTRARYAAAEMAQGLERSSAAVFVVEPGMAFRRATIRAAVHHAIGRRYRKLPTGAVELLASRPADWPVLVTGMAAIPPGSSRRYRLDGEETDPYVKLDRLACARIALVGGRCVGLPPAGVDRFDGASLEAFRDRIADELHAALRGEVR